jgi:hypothetical protein
VLVGPEGTVEFALEPVLQEDVLTGLDAKGFPVLHREPLGQAENNHFNSWPVCDLFGPILVDSH